MKLKDLIISDCNVRERRDEDESIESLAGSIKDHQLISKIILRTSGDKFEIIAGQRRYMALLKLNGEEYDLPEEDYVIKVLDDNAAFLLSIQENQQRVDLSPMELNRAALRLNLMEYRDKEVAKILNIAPYRLKRIQMLSADMNKMPLRAKEELSKPIKDSKFNDAHWHKVRALDDTEMIKDVVDMIVEKESTPKDIPAIIKGFQKQYEAAAAASGDTPSENVTTSEESPLETIEYRHKGELKMVVHGDDKKIVVLGKEEDEEVPVDHYIQYLRNPDKFKCYVDFKLKIKPIE